MSENSNNITVLHLLLHRGSHSDRSKEYNLYLSAIFFHRYLWEQCLNGSSSELPMFRCESSFAMSKRDYNCHSCMFFFWRFCNFAECRQDLHWIVNGALIVTNHQSNNMPSAIQFQSRGWNLDCSRLGTKPTVMSRNLWHCLMVRWKNVSKSWNFFIMSHWLTFAFPFLNWTPWQRDIL